MQNFCYPVQKIIVFVSDRFGEFECDEVIGDIKLTFYRSVIFKEVIKLCKECREKFPNKSQWMWTGYTFEEIVSDPAMKDILNYVDVIVDGPFVESKKDLSCPFRGSRNQRVIDVKKTMERKHVVEVKF